MQKCLPAIEQWQITGLDIALTAPRKCWFDSHDERRNQPRNDNLFSTRNKKCVRHCSGWNDIWLAEYCHVNRVQHRLIPAWNKEFSYITFLYRTLAKVNALARADITSIHSQSESKEIFDLKLKLTLSLTRSIKELWFLIPCHRCEKYARESCNSQ